MIYNLNETFICCCKLVSESQTSEYTVMVFSAWTTANIWEMETFYRRGYRLSKMLSTSSVTPKHAATQKTTWASSPWQSKFVLHNTRWCSAEYLIIPAICAYFWLIIVDLCEASRLLSCSNCEVLTTLTPDTGRILSKLHAVQPRGKICFCTGIRVAHVCSWIVYYFSPIHLICSCDLSGHFCFPFSWP